MDCARPSLELKHFEDICPDKNGTTSRHNCVNWGLYEAFLQVPVIAVFTKFDQFKREIRMRLEDQDRDADDSALLNSEMERIFKEEFLANLKESPPIVRLESENFDQLVFHDADCRPAGMHRHGQRCTDLIEATADALSDSVVTLMLLAVQKDNLELNINRAVKW